jgi:hypothetical protein
MLIGRERFVFSRLGLEGRMQEAANLTKWEILKYIIKTNTYIVLWGMDGNSLQFLLLRRVPYPVADADTMALGRQTRANRLTRNRPAVKTLR